MVEDGDAGGDVRAPATGRDPGAHASETSQIEGYQFRARIAHHPSGFVRTSSDQGDLDAAGQSILLRRAGGPCARGLRPGRTRPGALGRVAERHRRGLVRERSGARSRARSPSRPGRPPDPRAARRRTAAGAASVERFAQRIGAEPGIVARRARDGAALARRARSRRPCPAACPTSGSTRRSRADQVPAAVSQAAAAFTIAVIDTGADLGAPDLARRRRRPTASAAAQADVTDTERPRHVRRRARRRLVDERRRHRGRRRRCPADGRPGGRRRRLVHGRRRGGRDRLRRRPRRPDRQPQPRRPVDLLDRAARGRLRGRARRAARRGGRQRATQLGNPVEYPAALLQPVGSRGVGGSGLAVGASTIQGARASFSSTGTHVSLAAPGDGRLRRRLVHLPASRYPRVALPGSAREASTATPAARRSRRRRSPVRQRSCGRQTRELRRDEVAAILEHTASGHGSWNPELGYGVLDVAAAVARRAGDTLRPGTGGARCRSPRPSAFSCSGEARRHAASPSGGARRATSRASASPSGRGAARSAF